MKKDIQATLDETGQAISQYVCWCTVIALHQAFGVGAQRLNAVSLRLSALEEDNTDVILFRSRQEAAQIRADWLKGIVTSEYRVPVMRTARSRREEQQRMAADNAAQITWQLFAKAVIDVLHYGSERMERLRKESIANLDQFFHWIKEDGADVALEKLRRCASEATNDQTLYVVEMGENEGAKRAQEEFDAMRNNIRKTRALKARISKSKNAPTLNVLANPVAQFEALRNGN